MALVEDALGKWFLDNAAVSALIGDRLTSEVLPQEPTFPAVTFRIISTTEPHALSARSGLCQSRIEYSCYGTSISNARAVSQAMRVTSGVTALKGVTNDVDIRGVMVEDGDRTEVEQPTDGSAGWRYPVVFDLMVSYLE